MIKYLVMWKDDEGMPRAWGYSRNKEIARKHAQQERESYGRTHLVKIEAEEIKEVKEVKQEVKK